MILLLFLLLGCSQGDFTIFKQSFKDLKIENNVAINERAFKTLIYLAKTQDFIMFKDKPYSKIYFIKKIDIKHPENYKVKGGEVLEFKKDIILIVGLHKNQFIFKPIMKKETAKVEKGIKEKLFIDIQDKDLTALDIKYASLEEKEEFHIKDLIDKVKDILNLKEPFSKLKESELNKEEREAIPLPK